MVTLASQPVTRSRTSLFLSYRDSAARPTPSTPFTRYNYDDDDLGDEEAGLIGGNQLRTPAIPQRGGSDDSALPPRWVDEADQVDSLVRQVKPKSASPPSIFTTERPSTDPHASLAVAHLDKLHAKHLLPGFKDRSAEEREIQALATSITSVRPLPRPRTPRPQANRTLPAPAGLPLVPGPHPPHRRPVAAAARVAPSRCRSRRGQADRPPHGRQRPDGPRDKGAGPQHRLSQEPGRVPSPCVLPPSAAFLRAREVPLTVLSCAQSCAATSPRRSSCRTARRACTIRSSLSPRMNKPCVSPPTSRRTSALEAVLMS